VRHAPASVADWIAVLGGCGVAPVVVWAFWETSKRFPLEPERR
jgi:hypothetical protein